MQTPSPKVSVVIAAYNVAEYIGETLESVFNQTFTDYEVIVINDGSEDESELSKVLAPYLERIVYRRQENRGLAAARNAGIRTARGHYIAFLDADDLWETEFLRRQIEFFEQERCDLAYTDALLFGDSEFSGRTFMEIAPSVGEVNFDSLIAARCNVIGSAVVARRQSLIDAGYFDEALRNAQDFDLWIRMALRGARMGYQRTVLVRYRYREGSLSGDAVNRVNRELRVYRKILQQYDLTPAQCTRVEQAILRLDRELNLVLGKEHLNRREFDQALDCFRKAQNIQSSWKLGVTCALLSIAPNIFTRLNSSLNARRRKRARIILRNTP